MNFHLAESMAAELYEAWQRRTPVRPITERYPGISLEDAYLIQLGMIERRVRAGERVAGRKVALTTTKLQELFQAEEPAFGHLTTRMVLSDGARVSVGALIQPRVKAEICFVLAGRICGPGIRAGDVCAVTGGVRGALEVVDSRMADGKPRVEDAVADNISAALAVVGGAATDLKLLDLGGMKVVVEKNGEKVCEASGAAILGDPAAAVAWLANKLAEFGEYLRAGEIVLPGAVSTAFAVAPGDFVRASFDGLGSVSVEFVP